jgi:hypothetical protein
MAANFLAADAQHSALRPSLTAPTLAFYRGIRSATRATHFEKSHVAFGFDWRHHWKAVDRGDGKEDGDGKIKRESSLPELRS